MAAIVTGEVVVLRLAFFHFPFHAIIVFLALCGLTTFRPPTWRGIGVRSAGIVARCVTIISIKANETMFCVRNRNRIERPRTQLSLKPPRIDVFKRVAVNVAVRREASTVESDGVGLRIPSGARIIIPEVVVMQPRFLIEVLHGDSLQHLA